MTIRWAFASQFWLYASMPHKLLLCFNSASPVITNPISRNLNSSYHPSDILLALNLLIIQSFVMVILIFKPSYLRKSVIRNAL